MILNRIAPAIEQHLIKEQAGFRSGKSCTSQLLNLTQHIEDGYEEGMITGTAFVDLSAAYDTVNHRLDPETLQPMLDSQLCRVIQNLLSDRRFYVELNNERSRWRSKERSTTGECSLPHSIQHIYERSANPRWNEEFHIRRRLVRHSPVPYLPWSRTTNWRGTDTLLQKQQSACESWQDASHGVSSAEQRGQKVAKSVVDLENTDTPKYLGVTLDRTLSYKTHIHNTKMNLLNKLANSRWGTNTRTMRTTAVALCYSTAEYAAPVWERSAYAHLLNPELN